MIPDQVEHLFALAFGFAVAGVIASLYQLLAREPASFGLLHEGPSASAFAAIPMLAFAAPFIIMRHVVRASPLETPGFTGALVATVVAGGWSLMSGTVVLMLLGVT
jgi:hypothetical protein